MIKSIVVIVIAAFLVSGLQAEEEIDEKKCLEDSAKFIVEKVKIPPNVWELLATSRKFYSLTALHGQMDSWRDDWMEAIQGDWPGCDQIMKSSNELESTCFGELFASDTDTSFKLVELNPKTQDYLEAVIACTHTKEEWMNEEE